MSSLIIQQQTQVVLTVATIVSAGPADRPNSEIIRAKPAPSTSSTPVIQDVEENQAEKEVPDSPKCRVDNGTNSPSVSFW